jgi:hypothetical protein
MEEKTLHVDDAELTSDISERDYRDRRDTRSNSGIWLSTIAAAVLLVGGLFLYRHMSEVEAPPKPAAVPPVARPAPPAEPTIAPAAPRYPVPAVAEQNPPPSLQEAPPLLERALARLIGAEAMARLVYSDDLVRRFVATVDNLPRRGSLSQARAVKPPPGRFLAGNADGLTIDPANEARYAPYVRLAESVDPHTAVDLYFKFYSAFQEQYALLGYPNGYFNDRLIEAIDDLLAAPDVQPPIQLVQPKTMYQFADADLEQLSAGQKAMIRLGSDNARRVKARLRETRNLLIARARTKGSPTSP